MAISVGDVGVDVTQARGGKWVTGAIGVRAVRAGFAGAVVGFEEAWVAGQAAGLHTGGGQRHCPLEILGTDFRLGPFGTSIGKLTLRVGGFWAIMKAPPGWGTLLWSLM